MKNKIVIVLFLLLGVAAFSQQKITWHDLSKVTFTEKYFPEHNSSFLHPTFSKSIKELDGKKITITGFFLNINPNSKVYILSKGPLAACFFCGASGPETAMELQFDKKQDFKTDQIVSVTGTLKLNDSDIEHFNYILTGCKAKLVK